MEKKINKKYPKKITDKARNTVINMAAKQQLDDNQLWFTEDGQMILLEDLRQSHLENILLMMNRKSKFRAYQRPALEAELKRRKKIKLVKGSKTGKLIYG